MPLGESSTGTPTRSRGALALALSALAVTALGVTACRDPVAPHAGTAGASNASAPALQLVLPPPRAGDPCDDRAALAALTREQGPYIGCGTLARFEIREPIERQRPALAACQRRAVAAAAPLRVVLRWTIDPSGRVVDLETVEPAPGQAAVAACLEDQVRALRFAPPLGGGVVHVTYPFVFVSGAD
jgi:hypothetical protein